MLGKGFFKEVLHCASSKMSQDLVGDKGAWGIPGQEQEQGGKSRAMELELSPQPWVLTDLNYLLPP